MKSITKVVEIAKSPQQTEKMMAELDYLSQQPNIHVCYFFPLLLYKNYNVFLVFDFRQ